MPQRKPKSVAQLKKLADKYFSIVVRMRDSDTNSIGTCITCSWKGHWRQAHAGHFVKRSVNLLRFDDLNVNLQCPGCNLYRYGEQYAYAKALDQKYGDGTAEKLMSQRYTTHKFTADELLSIIEDCKQQIKFYESQLT